MATHKPRQIELPSLAQANWLAEPRLQALLAVLSAEGGEARVAGGAVRNALLGVPVSDIDIATTLSPADVSQRCQHAGFAVHPTGIEHGTVTVVNARMPFEVTTLRRDVTTDGRRATVTFTGDWAADAARRDFTMNAMYCDANGKIYDFTDGYEDIQKRKVKFVGGAARRIREDYLRILRFFRFHAHYGKGKPDTEGLAACVRLRKGIRNLSAERITAEIFKLLAAESPTPVLRVMHASGILKEFMSRAPEWHTLRRVKPDLIHRLFALNGGSADFGPSIRLSNQQAKRLRDLSEAPRLAPAFNPAERRHLLYILGEQSFSDAVALSWARSRAAMDDRGWQALTDLPTGWSIPTFPLTGKDLQRAGLAPGPAMGQTLRALEQRWIASDFALSRADLIAQAQIEMAPIERTK